MKFLPDKKFILIILLCSSFFLKCPPEIRDEIPPVVTIIYPVTGQVVAGILNFAIGASDETELRDLTIFIDGIIVASAKGPLLNYTWDTTPIADNREHSLYATATDGNNNNSFSGTVIVQVVAGPLPDNTPPTISILNPLTGSTISDTVNVSVQALDDTGIDRIEYYVDGSLDFVATQKPYNYQWVVTNFINGSSHNIYARAYDPNQNNSVSNIVSVNIQNTDINPPTILITYPSQNSTFIAGEIVDIRADAQDNIGIQRVEFFIDGILRITDTSIPYSYEWDTSQFGDGRPHTIYVKAFDFAGNNNAQLITVTVNP
jgi:hypothetical protein